MPQKLFRKKLLQDQTGFTLIELMVAFFMTVLVIVITSSILISSQSIFFHHASLRQEKLICDRLIDYIQDQLHYGKDIRIGGDALTGGGESGVQYLSVRDGRLVQNGNDPFGDALYGNCRIDLTASPSPVNPYVVDITIVSFNVRGEEGYSKSKSVHAVNMDNSDNPIGEIGGSGATHIYYTPPDFIHGP